MKISIFKYNNFNFFPTSNIVDEVLKHRIKLMNHEQPLIPHIKLTAPIPMDIVGNTPGTSIWIALTDTNEIIGSVGLKTEPMSIMHSLWVEEEYRKIGIGKLLYSAVREYCSEESHKFKFFVLANNIEAIEFYKKVGNYASYVIMQPDDLE